MKLLNLSLILLLFLFSSCNDEEEEAQDGPQMASCYQINTDSAYGYLSTQVEMGPRIPGTSVQRQCAKWLENQMKEKTDAVYVQDVQVDVNGKKLPCINIIGSINPSASNRILLAAHWDTRPFADKEGEGIKMDGADDGASGVGLLIEIARQLKGKLNNTGVDIVLFDVEDYGNEVENSYCQGSQYWSKNPHVPNYSAQFGILVDMIAGKGNLFYQELYSKQYAQSVLNDVWNTATALGYGDVFRFSPGMGVTDDHYYINTIRNIPTIDIIGHHGQNNFPGYHHRSEDNISIIDKSLLQKVGNTILQVICNQEAAI